MEEDMTQREKGFTLIEIVMVLVLLGILAAVAIPKYYDLQDKAREQAAKTVAAEFQARLNAQFAKSLLQGKACGVARTEAIAEAKTSIESDLTAAKNGFTIRFNEPADTKPQTHATLVVTYQGGTPSVTVPMGVPVCEKP